MAKNHENLDAKTLEKIKYIKDLSKESHKFFQSQMGELCDLNEQLCEIVDFLLAEGNKGTGN